MSEEFESKECFTPTLSEQLLKLFSPPTSADIEYQYKLVGFLDYNTGKNGHCAL